MKVPHEDFERTVLKMVPELLGRGWRLPIFVAAIGSHQDTFIGEVKPTRGGGARLEGSYAGAAGAIEAPIGVMFRNSSRGEIQRAVIRAEMFVGSMN